MLLLFPTRFKNIQTNFKIDNEAELFAKDKKIKFNEKSQFAPKKTSYKNGIHVENKKSRKIKKK